MNNKHYFNKNKPRDTFKQSYSPSPKKVTIDDFLNDDDNNHCDEYLMKLQKDKKEEK